jgi:hypothetical protein
VNEDEREFESRFKSLEDASRALSSDVSALNETLIVVGELGRRQREQAEKIAAAEDQVISAKRIADARDARTRRVVNMVAVTLGVLLPVVSILVYLALIQHVNELLTEQYRTSYTSCTLRNQVNLDNAEREGKLASIEKDPEVARIHSSSAEQLRASLVDCSRFKKYQDDAQ